MDAAIMAFALMLCVVSVFFPAQLVMSSLQSILENLDTPEVLCQSVKCILLVARCYPHVFSTNFRVRTTGSFPSVVHVCRAVAACLCVIAKQTLKSILFWTVSTPRQLSSSGV